MCISSEIQIRIKNLNACNVHLVYKKGSYPVAKKPQFICLTAFYNTISTSLVLDTSKAKQN